eukprot:scaffold20395_cov128-Isochrysis_galbana.AAC.3
MAIVESILREVCETASGPILLTAEKRRREGAVSKRDHDSRQRGCSQAATPTGPPRHEPL